MIRGDIHGRGRIPELTVFGKGTSWLGYLNLRDWDHVCIPHPPIQYKYVRERNHNDRFLTACYQDFIHLSQLCSKVDDSHSRLMHLHAYLLQILIGFCDHLLQIADHLSGLFGLLHHDVLTGISSYYHVDDKTEHKKEAEKVVCRIARMAPDNESIKDWNQHEREKKVILRQDRAVNIPTRLVTIVAKLNRHNHQEACENTSHKYSREPVELYMKCELKKVDYSPETENGLKNDRKPLSTLEPSLSQGVRHRYRVDFETGICLSKISHFLVRTLGFRLSALQFPPYWLCSGKTGRELLLKAPKCSPAAHFVGEYGPDYFEWIFHRLPSGYTIKKTILG